jgi:chloramphenicol O-acetyltransferase type A
MRTIDMANWPRRQHFQVYNALDYPHFNLCANVDITALYPFIKEHGLSFTVAVTYLLARVANAIPEFRYRIHGEQVVEYDVVHPSITLLAQDDLFSFCTIPFVTGLDRFAARAEEAIARTRAQPTLHDEPGQDDLLFMTGIPWVSFTSLMHPILRLRPADSVPRIAWGKYFTAEGRLQMPLSVQCHHGLMDGVHAGRYFVQVQEELDDPERLLEGAE